MRKHVIFLLFSLYPLVFSADAVNYEEKSITIALTQEPPSLNSLTTTDLVSLFVLGHVNEGLLRYDERGRLAPGVASTWSMDQSKMSFQLRPDARWSNGEPVTADDFIFAWRMMVDPAVAARYATKMYPVKNAEKIHKGMLGSHELGIKAMGPHRLEVELETPCGYCLNLMVLTAFYPINADFFHRAGAEYGTDADKILYNGPFVIESWVHDSSLSLLKNEHYWKRFAIRLNRINVGYITSDNRSRLNLFRDNQIALARLGAQTVNDALNLGLPLKTFVTGGLSFLRFNFSPQRATRYSELRQAMRLVIDPQTFTDKVISMPGYKPAYSYFPSWLKGSKASFISEYPPQKVEVDSKRALDLIHRLRSRLNAESGTDIGPLTLLTVTSPTGAKVAEYFQGLFKEKLGLEIKVDQQTFKQYLEKNRTGDFDIALSSGYPDFDDLVAYADLLATWNPDNRGGYSSKEYDHWLSVLQRSIDVQERLKAASRLQKLIHDDVPVVPLVETGSTWLQHPQLKGVIRRVLGVDPDYTYARIVE